MVRNSEKRSTETSVESSFLLLALLFLNLEIEEMVGNMNMTKKSTPATEITIIPKGGSNFFLPPIYKRRLVIAKIKRGKKKL